MSIVLGLLLPQDRQVLDLVTAELPASWEVVPSAGTADDPAFLESLPRLDCLIVYNNRLERRHIERASRLKLVQKFGMGVDDINVAACRERGIALAVCPVGGTDAVAEHTLALILASLKRIVQVDGRVRRDGQWPRWEFRPLIRQLGGSTVGVLGFGNIGRATATRLMALGADVLVYRRAGSGGNVPYPAARSPRFCESLDKLFDESSVVTLHLPLDDSTRGIVDENLLCRLGPDGILVNVARGGVVNEAALARVLADGRLGYAALDVLSTEPPDPAHPLLSLPNLLVTPHIAAGGLDTLRAKARFAAANIANHAAGRQVDSLMA